MISQISIPDIISVMPKQFMQPHTIHPTTLDAIMHGALLIKENTSVSGSSMPVFIGELCIEPSIAPEPSQNAVIVDLQSSHIGPGLSLAGISAFSNKQTALQKQPFLTISGAELRRLETASTQQLEMVANDSHDGEEMAYTMKWISDINFVERFSDDDFLPFFARQLFLKYSQLDIIEVNADRTGGYRTQSILKAFAGEDEKFVRSYYFTGLSQSSFEAPEQLSEWLSLLQFKALDINQSPAKQGFTAETFDLAIVSLQSNLNLVSLSNLRSLLRLGGRLVILTHDRTVIDRENLNSQLRQCSFNGIETHTASHTGFSKPASILVSKAIGTEMTGRESLFEIVAAASETQQSVARYIQHYLMQSGFTNYDVSITNWEDLEYRDKHTRKVYVILDEAAKSVWLDSTNELIFRKFIKLIQNESNILCISYRETSHGASTAAGAHGLIDGIARTARAEYPGLKFVTLHVRDSIQAVMPTLAEKVWKIIQTSVLNPDSYDRLCEEEFVYQNNEILVPRLLRSTSLTSWTMGTAISKKVAYGDPQRVIKLRHLQSLPSLHHHQGIYFDEIPPRSSPLAEDEVLVSVKAHSLTLDNLGKLKQLFLQPEIKMIYEISGVVNAIGAKSSSSNYRYNIGDRVCGWVSDSLAYASTYRAKVQNIIKLPDRIPMAIGATLPFTLIAAYQSLLVIGNLQRNQSVLISGPVNDITRVMAKMAQQLRASVFATFSTEDDQRDLIQRVGIPSEHVFCECTSTAKSQVPATTATTVINNNNNRSFDLVVRLLGDSEADFSMQRFVIESGIYIQLDNSTENARRWSPPTYQRTDIMAVSLNVHKLMSTDMGKLSAILDKSRTLLGQELSESLIDTPSSYPIRDIDKAINAISSPPRSKERVVLRVDDDDSSLVQVKRNNCDNNNNTNWKIDAHSTYLVTGGFGDIGQRVCYLLACQGAKHILILSRKTPSSEKKRSLERKLQQKSAGLAIHCLKCDISSKSAVEKIRRYLDTASGIPPIKGVIHSAVVLAVRLKSHP